jgi:hypothetical protein
MVGNSEIEQRWIEVWNDLYDLVSESDRWSVKCLLPDGNVVDLEECQGWLQDSTYKGWYVKVEAGWVLGKHGIIALQWVDNDF